MRYLSRNTLTTKLVLLTGFIVTAIIIITSLIFTATYNFLLEREVRGFLVKEGEEVISEQIVYDAGIIKYHLSSSGENLADRLRSYNISAVIFDLNLNRLGSYGIYKNLTDTNQLSAHVPPDYLQNILHAKQPNFSSFILPSGISYDTYTTLITSSGQTVGLIQFAKESDFKSRISNLNLTVLAFLLPLVILASWFVYRFIIRRSLLPLNELISHLQQVQPHHTLQKITLTSHATDEITELVDTFNNLLDRIGDSLTRQKDFIAHASHELRTPLTQAISSLDLAIHFKDSAKCAEYVTIVKQDLFNLNQILDSLLLLSRLEDPTTPAPLHSQSLNLHSAILSVLNSLETQLQSKHLSLKVDCDPSLHLHFPKEHLQILLSNLISNAIKYNQDGGAILISANAQLGKLILGISNTGPGLTPSEQAHVFDKFYRGKTSSGVPGSGLGLAIVKRICDLNHVNLSVNSTDSSTAFVLSFHQS